ncbi:MAG: sigma-70 family RNA polymerase sigma factor [Proteobacteria bacterium]|nr:sigma-70 family RNA polymerase sigma factor [Pseudomonadota bacterium]
MAGAAGVNADFFRQSIVVDDFYEVALRRIQLNSLSSALGDVTDVRNTNETRIVTSNTVAYQEQGMEDQKRSEVSFADETDVDLLGYMSMRDEDPETAREAWAEFYIRHVDYLYGVCHHAYAYILGGGAGVGDIVAETFHRAFRKAGLFDTNGIEDPVRIRRRTRAWLGRIAQRLVLDTLRNARRLPTYQIKAEAWENIPEQPRLPPRDDDLIRRVRDALEQLSEKEQIVIRVTFEWYQPGRNHQRLPNDVVADLAATLETTPENLRQIRRRALNKIRTLLKQPTGAANGNSPSNGLRS